MTSDACRGADEFRGVDHPLQAFPVLQHLAATVHHAEQGVFGDVHKDAGLMADQVADAAD